MTIQNLPFTSLPAIILTTGPFFFFWSFLKGYVDKFGAFRWVETLRDAHNFIVAAASLVLAAYVADIGHNFLTRQSGYEVDPGTLGYCYHVLKLYEYLDIILAILAGDTVINKYTAFSHLALPYWSFYRVIQNDALDWRFQVIADCSVRFLSRAVPWLVPDVRTEEIILGMAEDWRWYPDLVISAFWATFMFQGKRDEKMGLDLFGPPREDEIVARVLSLLVLLYGGHLKRREDAAKVKPATQDKSQKVVPREALPDKSPAKTSVGSDANSIRLQKRAKKQR